MLTIYEYALIFIVNISSLALAGSISYYILRREIAYTIEGFMELFTGAVTEPNVKRAMSILGKESGKVRASEAVVNKMATGVLSGPQLAGLKMAAKAVGIDLDGLIEEYGATETIAGLTQLGQMLGIDVSQLLTSGITQGIKGPVTSNTSSGAYLKG